MKTNKNKPTQKVRPSQSRPEKTNEIKQKKIKRMINTKCNDVDETTENHSINLSVKIETDEEEEEIRMQKIEDMLIQEMLVRERKGEKQRLKAKNEKKREENKGETERTKNEKMKALANDRAKDKRQKQEKKEAHIKGRVQEKERDAEAQDKELESAIEIIEDEEDIRRRCLSREKWWIKHTANNGKGTLLGEDGEELHRKLGLNDGQRRDAKVESIKGTVYEVNKESEDDDNMYELQTNENKKGWYNLNFGRTFMSKGTKHNLMGALTASRKGIGTHIPIGGENSYLFDS